MAPLVSGENQGDSAFLEIASEAERALWDSYEPDFLIGQGSYGLVIAATRVADRLPVAVKIVESSLVKFEKSLVRYPKEVLALEIAKDVEGVVNLVEWCDSGDKIYIVMERPPNSVDLKDYLTNYREILTQDQAKIVMTQIVKATHELMNLGIMHRDLKVENILMDLNLFKVTLIDFGLVAKISSPKQIITTKVGTLSHFPPEFFTKKHFTVDAGSVWAMGIILHQILLGYMPFESEEEIARGHFYTPAHLTPDGKDFLRACLNPNPSLRPTFSQLVSHPWISEKPAEQEKPNAEEVTEEKEEATVEEVLAEEKEPNADEMALEELKVTLDSMTLCRTSTCG